MLGGVLGRLRGSPLAADGVGGSAPGEEPGSPSSGPWVPFAQREDLTVRLRNILEEYAFGPGVFRELVQNADDAGARRLVLVLDGATHPGGPGLVDARLGQWQGPAVCAFNDAEFADSDFEGICSVGASVKRGDHTKIGHYGLGFNATYHLSDVISFVSRDRLCIFDPHRRHLPSGLSGLQLRLGEDEMRRYHAQLAPFAAVAADCGADRVAPLRGALFRFPLRTRELAERSEICGACHTVEGVLGVLTDLLRGAHELLLFLQSLESVEVLLRPCGGGETRRLGGASLRAASEAAGARLRQERRLLPQASGGQRGPRRAGYAFAVDSDVPAADGGSAAGGVVRESSAWLVAARSEPAAAARAGGAEAPEHRCGAVALRLWPPAAEKPLEGRAFCFLPLSLSTGLPAHASANFAISTNRRDLWRRSDDKESSHGTLRAAWNEELLTGTLPRAYADALELRAAGLAPPASGSAPFEAVDLLPAGPWSETVRGPCAPEALWGLWPAAAEGLFGPLPRQATEELFSRQAAVFWDAGHEQYRPPKRALLCADDEYARLDSGMCSALAKLRVAGSRRGVVEVPARLRALLAEVKGSSWLGPQPLAQALRSSAPELTASEADSLNAYLLGPSGTGPLTVLHGLRLCPLARGGLALFQRPGAAADIWWAEDSELQELLPHRSFIDSSSATFRLLRPRAANAPLNLRLLNARALPLLLPAVLPPHWRGKPCVTARGDEVLVDGTPSRLLAAAAAGAGQAGAPRGGARQAGRQRGGGASRAPAMAKGGAKGGGRRGPNLGGSRHRGKRRGGAGGLDDYDADDWREEEWRDEDEDEEEEEEETEHEEAESISQVADQHGPAAEVAEEACVCHIAAELRGVVRRCELLWRVVENAHEKGANPLQVVSDFPCVPLVGAPDGAEEAPCLVSVHEAVRRRALSAEDFPQADRETLQRCGVLIARPGKRLRAALSLEKSSTLAALRVAFADRWQAEQRHPAEGPAPCRLHRGLQPLRVPVGQSRPLLALVSRFVEKGLVPRDPSLLQALPLYETRGGRFAVPLVPAGACVVAPSEDWDEVLEPDFADYLVSWDGEAGLALQALADRERGSVSRFLADFVAPRLGVFGQDICVKALEAVATLGAAPWQKAGASRELERIATACAEAPLVVFDQAQGQPAARQRCSDLVDPDDAALGALHGANALFPPEAYRTPVVLSVMRKAGLASLSDEDVFFQAARAAEASPDACEAGSCLLRLLRQRWEALRWSTRAYTALGRLRIFPAMPPEAMTGAYPPAAAAGAWVPCALDGPCTLFQHAEVTWTQLSPLDPGVLDGWPPGLLRRFGALKDPPPLEVVVANLVECAARWALEPPADAATRADERQRIVRLHLCSLRALNKRSQATQLMVHHSLVQSAFVVLDDGSLARPCDVFTELHSGGDSDAEEGPPRPAAETGSGTQQPDGGGHQDAQPPGQRERRPDRRARPGAGAGPWLLPGYLRPFRRLLLGIAGPAAGSAQGAPKVHVGQPPPADAVPLFLQAALNEPELADVEFTLRPWGSPQEPQTVFAHRLILAAACEHFRTMFTSGCAESCGVGGRAKIDMPDWVTRKPLLWLLAYLYQGYDPQAALHAAARLEARLGAGRGLDDAGAGRRAGLVRVTNGRLRAPRFLDEAAGEDLCCLLRLCEFYDVRHLKQWAEHRLQQLLTPENLLALSTHAYFCRASQLLDVCVYHMQQVYAEIASTEEWRELEPAIRDLVLADRSARQPKVALAVE